MDYQRKIVEFFLATIIGFVLSLLTKADFLTTTIFSALIFIIFILLDTQRELSLKIPNKIDQRKILDSLDTIDRQIIPIGYKRFKFHKDFYESLAGSLGNAHTEILLTHIRHETPEKYVHGKQYFDNVIEWAKSHSSGVVKRISCRSNDSMSMYCDTQIDISKNIDNYFFKSVEWNSPFPNINFAIIDRSKVYIALSGSVSAETAGLYLDDEKAASYFREYFESVFAKG